MVLTIKMQWNEPLQKWLMYQKDTLLYDFFNCGNVKLAFKGLNKLVAKKYEITIKALED